MKEYFIKLIINVLVALAIFIVIGLFGMQFTNGEHSILGVWQFWFLIVSYPVLRELFRYLKI